MLKWVQKLTGKPWVPGYKVGDEIFAGGFSRIYRAVQKKTNRDVALKVLNEEGVKIAGLMNNADLTLWEGELIGALDHPNIIKCYECGCEKDYYWIALEYVENHLDDYWEKSTTREQEDRALDLILQLIRAVAYVHRKGYIHRDIAMNNILVTESGVLKLIDFGLTVHQNSSVTRGKAGTPSYMAPELIRKSRHSVQTDIYSLGVVMYELVTHEKPFKGEDAQARMVRSLNVKPPTPGSVKDVNISPELEHVITKAMDKDTEERFQTVDSIENALILLKHKRQTG